MGAEDVYFPMAFFFGFLPRDVDEMEVGTVLGLLDSLNKNAKLAGARAAGKLMGL
jgi:hypothetical protein